MFEILRVEWVSCSGPLWAVNKGLPVLSPDVLLGKMFIGKK